MHNKFVSVYVNGDRIQHKKRKVMAPGEMEEIVLKKDLFKSYQNMSRIKISVEEA